MTEQSPGSLTRYELWGHIEHGAIMQADVCGNWYQRSDVDPLLAEIEDMKLKNASLQAHLAMGVIDTLVDDDEAIEFSPLTLAESEKMMQEVCEEERRDRERLEAELKAPLLALIASRDKRIAELEEQLSKFEWRV